MVEAVRKLTADAFPEIGTKPSGKESADIPSDARNTNAVANPPTNEDIRSARREGYAKGYADGVEAGGIAARAQAHEQTSTLMTQLGSTLSASLDPLIAQFEDAEARRETSVRALMGTIIKRLATKREASLIETMLRNALHSRPERAPQIDIRVPPGSETGLESLLEHFDQQGTAKDNSKPFRIVTDPELEPGALTVVWRDGCLERAPIDADSLVASVFEANHAPERKDLTDGK